MGNVNKDVKIDGMVKNANTFVLGVNINVIKMENVLILSIFRIIFKEK